MLSMWIHYIPSVDSLDENATFCSSCARISQIDCSFAARLVWMMAHMAAHRPSEWPSECLSEYEWVWVSFTQCWCGLLSFSLLQQQQLTLRATVTCNMCAMCVCVFVSGQTGSWTQARLEFRVDAQTHKSSRCYGRSSNGEVVNAAVAAKTATIATACLRSQLII